MPPPSVKKVLPAEAFRERAASASLRRAIVGFRRAPLHGHQPHTNGQETGRLHTASNLMAEEEQMGRRGEGGGRKRVESHDFALTRCVVGSTLHAIDGFTYFVYGSQIRSSSGSDV